MSLSRFIGKNIQPLIGGLKLGENYEDKIIELHKDIIFKPIFIIGLPRSGSTLLYQSMIRHFRLTYFSNLVSVFYKYPVLISRCSINKQKSYVQEKYESEYGVAKGLYAPSEAGKIFRFWFANDCSKSRIKIKNSISALSNIYNRPFVWKNLNLSFYIKIITEIFPNSLFILMTRDMRFISQSIYLSTQDSKNINYKGFSNNDLNSGVDVLEKITRRICKIEKKIKKNLLLHSNNYIEIQYSELCNNLPKTMELISSKYDALIPTKRNNLAIKSIKIKESKNIRISLEKWEKIEEIIFGINENNI